MSPSPRTLILADSHLRGRSDPRQEQMVEFLRRHCAPDTTLVLLGDFFEFLAGDNRAAADAYAPVLAALRDWPQVHYLEGNHDFDLSARTPGLGHVHIHPETARLRLAGLRCLLMHGDRSSPHDHGTRILRAALQSRLMRLARDRILPDAIIFRFALGFASFSRRRTWPGRGSENNEARKRAEDLLGASDLDAVIFAHTHEALLHLSPSGWLANPGAAQAGGSYLEITAQTPRLRRFPDGGPLPDPQA